MDTNSSGAGSADISRDGIRSAKARRIEADATRNTASYGDAISPKYQSIAVVATRLTIHDIRESLAKMLMLAANGEEVAREVNDFDAVSTFRAIKAMCRMASNELDSFQGLPDSMRRRYEV